jgi:hypothetical protein
LEQGPELYRLPGRSPAHDMGRSGSRSARIGCWLRRALIVKLFLAWLLAMGLLAFGVRLAQGPLQITGLSEQVTMALARQIGENWQVSVGDTALVLREKRLHLQTNNLEIRNPQGLLVLKVPQAFVGLDHTSLLRAVIQIHSVEFSGLEVKARIETDGTLRLAASGEDSSLSPGASTQDSSAIAQVTAQLLHEITRRDGAIGALQRAKMSRARLILVDARGHERAAFLRVEAVFERIDDERRRFITEFQGPRGTWKLHGEANGESRNEASRNKEAQTRSASITVERMPLGDLALLTGFSHLGLQSDLALTGQAQVRIVNGRLVLLHGEVSTGRGLVQLGDDPLLAAQVEKAVLALDWQEESRTLLVMRLSLEGEGHRIALEGRLNPGEGESWHYVLEGKEAHLRGATSQDAPVIIDALNLRGVIAPTNLSVEAFALNGPCLKVIGHGAWQERTRGNLFDLTLDGSGTCARPALRLWPTTAGPVIRRWLVANLKNGDLERFRLNLGFTRPDLDAMASGRSPREEALTIDFTVRETRLGIAPSFPDLTKAALQGHITGRSLMIHAASGEFSFSNERRFGIVSGRFRVDNFWPDDTLGHLDLSLRGGADALAELANLPAFRGNEGIDLKPEDIRGQADLRIILPLALYTVPKIADLPLEASGSVTHLSVDKAFGSEKIEQGNFSLTLTKGDITLRGDARLSGIPAQIDIRQPREGRPEATITMVLDEAARTRRGLETASWVKGPVPVRLQLTPGAARTKNGTRIEADLSRATLDLLPGITKPAGRAGKLSLTLIEDGEPRLLRDIVLESGNILLRGQITLGRDGGWDEAEFPVFRLSQGDDMRLKARREGTVLRAELRGNLLDARPFLKPLLTPATARREALIRETGFKETGDFDLDLVATMLTGLNGEVLTGIQANASRRDGEWRQVRANARLGIAPVSLELPRTSRILTLQTGNAGGILRFIDLYRRMAGGSGLLRINLSGSASEGTLQMRDFVLRNEPALSRLSAQPGGSQNQPQGGQITGQTTRLDAPEVAFAGLKADFMLRGGQLALHEGALWGNQLGFTGAGSLDLFRNLADISGTFVPAYGVNNIFSQVPVVGAILGGSRNEGLIGVNFRIAGSLDTPVVTVNPLSAIAPGIFRRMFEAGSEATGALPSLRANPRD